MRRRLYILSRPKQRFSIKSGLGADVGGIAIAIERLVESTARVDFMMIVEMDGIDETGVNAGKEFDTALISFRYHSAVLQAVLL